MRGIEKLALYLFGAAAVAYAAEAETSGSSDVFDLKTDNFPGFIKENPLVLAEFFAPWCGHCKALAPEYEEAATTLKEKNIKLAKVDCTEEADLCKEYGVEGYPTLKIFRGADNVAPYSGPRKAAAITSYMIKASLPAVSLLTSDTLEEFKTSDKVVLIAYLTADDKASNTTYGKVADALRENFLFGATNDATLAKADGVTAPALVMYKQFDDGKTIYSDSFDVDAITKFVKGKSIPLIGEVGPETYSGYMEAGIPLAYIFAETEEERKELADELKPLAVKHQGVISFATIDAKQFGAHAENLNLKADAFPAFAIQEISKNQKFPFSQDLDITAKSIGKFVDDFVAGKIDPSIKSEPVPTSQDGPVHIVVANNYQEIVMDDTKDVLIEFYAPWCGHCKALAPKYDILGGLYYNDPDLSKKVTIAKVDATLNDVPDEIQGFPTLKLYPADKKDSPVTYSGSREIDDLAKFIAENGKHGAKVTIPGEGAADDTESLVKQARAATEKASASAKSAADQVKETVSSAGNEAQKTASSASGKAASAASSVSDKAASAASSATGTAASAASSVSGSAASAASSVSDAAASAASSASGKAASGASAVSDSATSVASSASGKASSAAEAIKETASSAAGAAASATEKVKETVSSVTEAIKETVTSATDAVKSKVAEKKDEL